MKMKLFAVMTLVGVLSLAGTAAADHLGKSTGNWKLVSAERHGEPLSKEEIANVTVTVTKSEEGALKIVTKQDDKVVTEATAKLAKGDAKPDAKHDQFDITYAKGSDKDGKSLKGKTLHGVISVDGDTMKVCWHGEEGYPKEFIADKDSHCTLRTFKRVK